MAKPTYYEMLRDPRWQRKRLEVMQRADFACEECGDKETTLNVHHQYYRKGAKPWEYEDDCFLCMCEPCHDRRHGSLDQAKELLGKLSSEELEYILGFIKGRTLLNDLNDDGSQRFVVAGYEQATGVADAYCMGGPYGEAPDKIISALASDGSISHKEIWHLKIGQSPEGGRG